MKARFAAVAALAAAGLLASAGVASASVPTAATATTAKPPATFVAVSPFGLRGRIAVYSASTGKLVKYLTPANSGVVTDPALSANGKTVAFNRFTGQCGSDVEAVPASGGPERALVPEVGSGKTATLSYNASYSTDGKFLIYQSAACDSNWQIVDVRNLSTGHVVGKHGEIGSPAVFIDNDSRVVFIFGGVKLAVLQLSSMQVKTYASPSGCDYGAVGGTSSELVALMHCGFSNTLRVLAISTSTFHPYKTIAQLGSCQLGKSVSVAAGDPSALLVETGSFCKSTSTPAPTLRVFKVIGGKVTLLLKGSEDYVPTSPVW